MHGWKRLALGLAAASTLWLTGCGSSHHDDPPPSIAQTAQDRGLTALVAASNKAGLTTTLSDASSNLTVFAPTNEAFGRLATQLGFANADALVAALPAATLANILQYHVLPARRTGAELAAGGATQATAYRFEGAPANLTLTTTSGVALTDAALTRATVTSADISASNGVVHVIDKVLVPPGVLNIVQMAQVNPTLSSLVGAVVATNLQGTLSGAGPFTVFAPTNDAFAAIASTTATLTTTQLSQVLTYHVLPSQVLAANIPFGSPVNTVLGQTITINAGTPPTITDTTTSPSRIVATNVRASNGVVHVIDKVLIPSLGS